jgi:RNA polymerase sigma-54 factor
MAISQRLDLRHLQSLVMTPQLQQAIKLLQLSNVELSAYIQQELERNPLLEVGDADGAVEAPVEVPEPVVAGTPTDTAAAAADDASTSVAQTEMGDAYEGVWEAEAGQPPERPEAAFDGGYSEFSLASGGAMFEGEESDAISRIVGETSLRDHLQQQLRMSIADPIDRVIGSMLIEAVDEAGYLAANLSDIAYGLNCPLARVESVLAICQQFDPPGILARDLRECLAIQLREKDRLDPAMAMLLEHLDLLGRREMSALQQLCGVDVDDLTEMIAEIRALNPKPAASFDSEISQTVVPDVFVRPQANGGFSVELNSDSLPRVLINRRYYTTVSHAARSKEEKEYITEQYNAASWLIRALDQRAQTVLKVASEIVRQQHGFFTIGVAYLKPLILRDISAVIGMHESTVSRVTANKFMATPRGTFELKYFFSPSLAVNEEGEGIAAESVRYQIKALIDNEDPRKILSDDKIVDILRDKGVDIARRTVAKYRETMRIPSSVQRRREKNLALQAAQG